VYSALATIVIGGGTVLLPAVSAHASILGTVTCEGTEFTTFSPTLTKTPTPTSVSGDDTLWCWCQWLAVPAAAGAALPSARPRDDADAMPAARIHQAKRAPLSRLPGLRSWRSGNPDRHERNHHGQPPDRTRQPLRSQ
jgi:hypothetical protein